jgi:hypothetical protein
MGTDNTRGKRNEDAIPGEPEEVRRLRERLLGRVHGRREHGGSSLGKARSSAVGAYRGHARFVEKLRKLVERRRSSFRSHFAVYLGVNGGLMLLNLITSPGFPWFLFPAGGWGIGIVNHYADYRRQQRVLQEAQELPPLNRESLDLYKKLKKKENANRAQVTSLASVGGFLALVNLITVPTVPWFLIPCGVFAAVTFASREATRGSLKEMRSRFAELQQQGGGWGSFREYPSEESAGVVAEAASLRAAILAQTEKLGQDSPFSEDITGVLDTYVEQIRLLSYQVEEIESLINSLPREELERDAAQLQAKREASNSAALQEEYENSLREIEQQKAAYGELEERREMLELRLRSAINALKRMNLDLARMKSVTQSGGTGLEDIKRKSEELSRYIDDLEQGYDELNREEGRGNGSQ